ncbi:modulator protein [Duganella sp. Leaf126]|uniref:LamG-like jellyroll fold domain-containing protein n=1 Tax=Duganella sp. Leaf126 TaxID=1736266 RepID=UPI0006F6E4A8|nr:LamG-like jellyroll fold domain-containing protein [Duganella sp. Leaf126]KQQ32378.1 modulator protein [Duganella sp. Leaf126]
MRNDVSNDHTPAAPTDTPRSGRRTLLKMGLASATGLSVGGLLAGCGGGSAAVSDTPAPAPATAAKISSFALAVLPDTQFYARYATSGENNQYERHYGNEPFAAQTSWVARNAQALNIPFLIHLGDVVDQVGKPEQWKVADSAMQVLEVAKLPYSILAGNHDVLNDLDYSGDQTRGTDAQRVLANEPYLQWFGTRRAQRQATFGARDDSGFHEYHIFTAQDQRFLVLSLSWRISDEGIAWARKVLTDHPTLPVILVNHQLLNIAPDAVSPLETDYGKMVWDKLIRDNDQIFMTLNGHHHGAAHLTKTNDFGNPVEEMVVDYQMAYQGGNGLMRLYEFDLTNKQIKVLSFSPWVPMKPADTLNSFDRAVLTETNQAFTIAIDFARRFARFNPTFGTGQATVASSLVEQARALVLKGYTEPAVVAPVAPKDADDYPKVASTVAHWRFFGGSDGAAVAPGTRIADVSGANPLVRDALDNQGVRNAEAGDIVWSSDRHHLSAAPGSVSFLNTDKNVPRLSYFLTNPSAAINAQTFATTGYTIEAFIKIAPGWNKASHAWMNIMTRDGRRSDLPGFDGGDGESPPLLFAISSLREVQWEVVPDVSGAREGLASWSGEIIAGTWVHIAIINDPVTHDTVMYVEGAPVLRNSSNVAGLATLSASAPWVVGGGSWDGVRADGFFGNIGEIRIAAGALKASQWLTARRTS